MGQRRRREEAVHVVARHRHHRYEAKEGVFQCGEIGGGHLITFRNPTKRNTTARGRCQELIVTVQGGTGTGAASTHCRISPGASYRGACPASPPFGDASGTRR